MAQEIGSGFEMPAPVVETPEPASQADVVSELESSNQVISGTRRLTDIVRSGGPLMIPIGICSFILVVFIFGNSSISSFIQIIPSFSIFLELSFKISPTILSGFFTETGLSLVFTFGLYTQVSYFSIIR